MPHPIQLFAVESGRVEGLQPPPQARTVHEVFDEVSGGVYTGMRTFQGNRFIGLDEHLDRIQNCMRELGWKDTLQRDELRQAIHGVVTNASTVTGTGDGEPSDSFLRLDVLPPGATFSGQPRRILIALGPLIPVPREFIKNGVRVEIADHLRRRDPRVKRSAFVPERRPYPLGTEEAFEHLLVDEAGHILEGTSSNFYALADGSLRTAGQGVLPGITRRFLVFLCAGLDIPIHMQPIHLDDLGRVEEAFLTSSTRGVVPIISVAGTPISSGRPGPRTRELRLGYEALTRRSAQPAWPPPEQLQPGTRIERCPGS